MNIEDVEERAILNLKKDGHCCGVILFDEPQFAIIPMNYNNEEQKNHFRNHVRRLFNDMKITRYFVVTETWVSSNPYVDAPSRDINRKEALMISEYSTDNINGKFVMILFSRKEENIVLDKKVIHEVDTSIDRFNFFKEELTNEEISEIKRKEAAKDLVRRIEHVDLKEEFDSFLKYFPDAKLTYEQFKKMFIKSVTDGELTFKNGIIPKKFRLPTDDIEEELFDEDYKDFLIDNEDPRNKEYETISEKNKEEVFNAILKIEKEKPKSSTVDSILLETHLTPLHITKTITLLISEGRIKQDGKHFLVNE